MRSKIGLSLSAFIRGISGRISLPADSGDMRSEIGQYLSAFIREISGRKSFTQIVQTKDGLQRHYRYIALYYQPPGSFGFYFFNGYTGGQFFQFKAMFRHIEKA